MGAVLGTIILVFGIRFLQASAVAGADAAHTDAYRKLASDAVTAQAGNAATLAAIQSELAELKTRLGNVEKNLEGGGMTAPVPSGGGLHARHQGAVVFVLAVRVVELSVCGRYWPVGHCRHAKFSRASPAMGFDGFGGADGNTHRHDRCVPAASV
jgi:hypothetical protein